MTTPARWARLGAVLAVMAVVILGRASPASAHASLVDTEPAAQAVLDQPPDRVAVRFNEAVGIPPNALRLFDATGRQIDLGPATHADRGAATITASAGGLPDGLYVVAWRAVSADAHPVQGAFTFQIGTTVLDGRSATDLLAQVLRTNGADTAAGVASGLARWAALAALALVIGTVAFPALTGADPRERALAAVAAPGPGGRVRGGRRGLGVPSAGQRRARPRHGHGPGGLAIAAGHDRRTGLARTGGAVARRRWRRAGGPPTVAPRAVDGAVVALTGAAIVASSLAGHGATGRYVLLGAGVTLAHTTAMGVWLGGLVVLAGVTLRSDGGESAGEVTARFSTVAFASVAVLVVTGTGQAWRQLGTVGALRDTSYGHLLVVKTVLVVAMVAVGALSRRVVHQRLIVRPVGAAPAAGARGPLRRRVMVEIGIGAVVLAVTAALMVANPAQATGGPVSRTLVDGDVLVSLSVDPARAGTNIVHLYLSAPGGSLQEFREVALTASLPDRQIGPLSIPLARSGPNHYTASAAQFPFAGRWQLSISALLTEFDRRILTTTVSIS